MKSKTTKSILKKMLLTAYFPVVAVGLALVLGALFIAALGFDWALAYQNLVLGALGNVNAISESLIKATPLIFTGLSFAIASRCGMINLGAEGQLYIGGLFSTWVGISFQNLPVFLHLPLALLAGMVGGGLWGMLTAWLKSRFGASELITSIMLNYIAIRLVAFFVTGPMKEPGGAFPQSAMIAQTAQLPRLVPQTRLHAGLLLALLCVGVYYVFLWRTVKGFEMRMVGLNPSAAEYAGIRVKRSALLSMTMAGAFAGLAGSSEILGIQLRLFQDFSQNYGFDGIAVALLGNNSPVGILLSGLLFGVLKSGTNKMQMTAEVPSSLVQIVQALVILFVVGRELFHFFGKDTKPSKRSLAKGRNRQ